MNTNEINHLLNAYLDDELPDSRRQKVESLLEKDEQIRQTLSDLNQVRQVLSDLPRLKAPVELAESVLYDLERDILLQGHSGFSEAAGHKHLRWRRWLETAAMLILAGAIVMIVYNVLHDNRSLKQSLTVENEPIVMLDDYPDESTDSTKKEEHKFRSFGIKPDSSSLNSSFTPEVSAPVNKMADLLIPNTDSELSYGTIKLVITYSPPQQPGLEVQKLIYDNQINHVVSNIKDPTNPQFAFMCTDHQFKNLFGELSQLDNTSMQIVLQDEENNRDIILSEPSNEEAFNLATEANRDVQAARILRMLPNERIAVIDNKFNINNLWYSMLTSSPSLPTIFPGNDLTTNTSETSQLDHLKENYFSEQTDLKNDPVDIPEISLNTADNLGAATSDRVTLNKNSNDIALPTYDSNSPVRFDLNSASWARMKENPVRLECDKPQALAKDHFQLEAESQKTSLIAVELLIKAIKLPPLFHTVPTANETVQSGSKANTIIPLARPTTTDQPINPGPLDANSPPQLSGGNSEFQQPDKQPQ